MRVFPGKQEEKITYVIVAFVMGLGIGLIAKLQSVPKELLIPAIATLFAAFLGAWAAFVLEAKRRKEGRETGARA